MKTIFIVNPKAGKKKDFEKFTEHIKNTAETQKLDADIYFTKSVGDAEKYVREYCEKNAPARFIACGGDGTLSEVLNGAIEYEDAEIGVVPMGTGNDFCRNFNAQFDEILLQMTGKSTKCDAIKYTTTTEGKKRCAYGVNMFNIGFDCNVANTTDAIKKTRVVWGAFAYLVSIFINLAVKRCIKLKIELDGVERHNGGLLLTSIANGSFCGGGIKSNPEADVKDGLISVNIIQNISRTRFISLLPYYIKGTLLKVKGIDKYVLSEKCKRIKITPLKSEIRFCIDGEIFKGDTIEFEIVHNAFNFVVPKKENTEIERELIMSKRR